ncbi:ABC-three component system protein [Aeromonas veronii]|uniref:ABC-three component system protein n=1 Tax=Aeromonas veronii TaxID=654 RepID=UPI0011167DF8|nr:ABC-three component system protein [Aeromonas veronii]TNI45678.1 hypothetical protein CF127_17140 [Aeromonas veronii]
MYSSTTQKHNQLDNGDLVGGNKFENNNYYLPQENKELIRLYEQFRVEQSNQTTCTSFSAKLQHYLTEITDSEVRGLDLKLKESGREDMIFFAQGLKEVATKQIMQYQTSPSAQKIYTIILDELHTKFMLTVRPQIQADASRMVIDLAIENILDKVRNMLGENALELTVKDLLGFLYFLGGNCHIRWDKC